MVNDGNKNYILDKKGKKLFELPKKAEVDIESYLKYGDIFKITLNNKDIYISRFTGEQVFEMPEKIIP